MEFHPASMLLPLMEGAEKAEHVEDIREHGQIEHIYTHDGMILDGRNRYNACMELGIKPKFMAADLNGGTPAEFVFSMNIARRHLTQSQRALLGAEIKKEFAASALERQKAGTTATLQQGKGASAEKAAQLVGSSPRAVAQATKVLATGDPSLVAAVSEGKVTVSDAAKVADKPKATQRKAVEAVASGKAKTVAAASAPKKPKPGSPTASFRALESEIGKVARSVDTLNGKQPGDKFARQILKHLNDSLRVLKDWEKACR